MEYLQHHQGRWRYRRRWPKDVAKLAKGGFFIKALGTGDRQEAKQRRALAELEFNTQVAALRRRLDAQPRELSESEAASLVIRAYREGQEHIQDWYGWELLSEYEIEKRKLEWRAGRARAPWDSGEQLDAEVAADKRLKDAGINVPREGPGYTLLVKGLEAVGIELDKEAEALHYSQPYEGPENPALVAALGTHKGKPSRTLGDLIEAYIADKSDGWSQRTRTDYEAKFRLLREVLGATRAVDSIDREAARELFDLIRSLPANMNRRPELKGLPIRDAVAKGQRLGLPTIAPKTVKDAYMAVISPVFEWAEAEDWIVKSHFRKLTVTDPVSAKDKRDPFTVDQLEVLFGSAPWCPRDDSPKGKPSYYWTPLLTLFHGMRLAEVCGLMTSDIKEIDGCPVIRVDDNEFRRVKNNHSRRTLPIHSTLIRLGFMDFVKAQQAAGHERLFPDALGKQRGQVGYNVGLWFSRRVKALKLEGKKLSFHSLRHSFEDRLREADLHNTGLGNALAGRSSKGVSGNYGGDYSTAKLKAAIERVEYPSLNL